MGTKRWASAQDSEARCWRNVTQKLSSEDYLGKKREYWNKIFNKINKVSKIDDSKSFLDFGCGPSGIVSIYSNKKDVVCLDPLMDEYLKISPFLSKTKAKFINSKIEDYSEDKFDYVFGFNSLDHVDSIKKSLISIKKVLKKEGELIISMNCHNLPNVQKVMLKTSFIFDKPHPHQYTLNQYCKMLRELGFEVKQTINLDDELHFMFSEKKEFNIKSFVKELLVPYFPLYIFGYSRYGPKKAKTIYSSNIIIAKLK